MVSCHDGHYMCHNSAGARLFGGDLFIDPPVDPVTSDFNCNGSENNISECLSDDTVIGACTTPTKAICQGKNHIY